MKIIHIASETAPIAKAGGLGDVIQGLSKELTQMGHQVRIFLPHYSWIRTENLDSYHLFNEAFPLQDDYGCHQIQLHEASIAGCKLLLFNSNHPKKFFEREEIYGYPDDLFRFFHFCRMCWEFLKMQKETIDVLHLHDWHTSLILLFHQFLHHTIKIKKCIFTIHNLEYQGVCSIEDLPKILNPIKIEKEFPDLFQKKQMNLLKTGIILSDKITTVSPSYAQEILTPQYGFGLESTLKVHRGKLFGILNGIDTEYWNPRHDPFIPYNFSLLDTAKEIEAIKLKNKCFLQKKLNMNSSSLFLIANVGRLAEQKGPFLLKKAIEYFSQTPHQIILLGSPSNAKIRHEFEQLKKQYTDSDHIRILFDYDEKLAHLIYAASDFLLMPSNFEPCGLSQRIAMYYGTIPIVRKTGGLKDTVFDLQTNQKKGNGFVFLEQDPVIFLQTLQRALNIKRETLCHLKKSVMQINPSWSESAKEYMAIYEEE